jgi:riboflavin transporter FmnP
LPVVPMPDLHTVMLFLIPTTLLIGTHLTRYRRSRPMAAVAIGVIVAYAAASFVYMMENLRYLLPAYSSLSR